MKNYMKQSVEKLVKNNRLINKMFTFFGSLLVRSIGIFVPIKKNKVLFLSFMGSSQYDSPGNIYDYLVKNNLDKNYEIVWAFSDVDKFDVKGNVKKIKVDTLSFFIAALSAEYWITNVNIERGLKFKKEKTKYLCTWHGIPFKKIGNDVKNRSDYDFSNIDMFLFSGNFEKDKYISAFNVNSDALRLYGMPRNDVLNGRNEETRDSEAIRVIKQIQNSDKKTIIYAPTWRESKQDVFISIVEWIEKLGNDYQIIVKAHHLVSNQFPENLSGVINASSVQDTNSLLKYCDVLVTDYSSIMFDYSLLKRPILLYVPDLEEYVSTRGSYFNLEEIGLSMFADENRIIEYIAHMNYDEESTLSENLAKSFFDVKLTNATEVVTKEFLGI